VVGDDQAGLIRNVVMTPLGIGQANEPLEADEHTTSPETGCHPDPTFRGAAEPKNGYGRREKPGPDSQQDIEQL
jgi:hypothetical protein